MRSSISLAHLSGRALILALCVAIPAAPAAAQSPASGTGKAAKGNEKAAKGTYKARVSSPKAAAQQAPAGKEEFVDGIAAVVNKDVITLSELNSATLVARGELKARGIEAPDDTSLKRQVLQRLIMDRIERQEADRMGIKVNDAQVDRAIGVIAQRNKMTPAQMKVEVSKTGVDWDKYRDSLRSEIRQDQLRQRAVDAKIVISDAEVDAFLKEQERQGATGQGRNPGAPAGDSLGAQQAPPQAPSAPAQKVYSGPALLALAQILVRVPETAMADQVDTLKRKAEGLLAKVKGGADFAAVAAASSDGPEALQGGVMGGRPQDGWPDLFLQAVKGLQPGQVSAVIKSGQGFHILKVLDRREPGQPVPAAAGQQQPRRAPPPPPTQAQAEAEEMKMPAGPMEVTQTHARHILIKTSSVMSDDQARQRLEQLRLRIVDGKEDFGELARQNSQDVSAPQGGDLGWLNPGDTVPAFEQTMNALKPNEVSQPVQSPFGWHLIQVLERRKHDVANEYKRLHARQVLFQRRSEPAFEDYLAQVRDQAYIDNRLEKQDRTQQNNQ